MHDDSVLVAIDAALRTPEACGCGSMFTPVERDGELWLECPSLTGRSRLPERVAAVIRGALHDRRFVVELPTAA